MRLVIHLLLFCAILIEQRDQPRSSLAEQSHGERCLSGAIRHASEFHSYLAKEYSRVLQVPGGIDGGYLQTGKDVGQRLVAVLRRERAFAEFLKPFAQCLARHIAQPGRIIQDRQGLGCRAGRLGKLIERVGGIERVGDERSRAGGDCRAHGKPGGGDLFKRAFDVARRLRGKLAHLVHAPGERRGVRLQVDGEGADGYAHSGASRWIAEKQCAIKSGESWFLTIEGWHVNIHCRLSSKGWLIPRPTRSGWHAKSLLT